MVPFEFPFENATPVSGPASGRFSFNPSPTHRVQAQTLAGWITLIAEDRGLNEPALATATGLDVEDVRAVLCGAVMMIPLTVLDRALRRLEGRAH